MRRQRSRPDRLTQPGHTQDRQTPPPAGPGLCGRERGGAVTHALAAAALDFCGVDAAGLDKLNRQFLAVLCKQFGGGPLGLWTLAASIGEETSTVDEVIELYLLEIGLSARTQRGRVATEATWAHLGLEPGAKGAPAVTQAALL